MPYNEYMKCQFEIFKLTKRDGVGITSSYFSNILYR